MKDEKILENEIMTDEELEKVSGGTHYETSQIINAIGQIYKVNGFKGDFSHPVTFYTYLPLDEVEPYLKKTYGIDAKLDCGQYDPAAHDFVTEGGANQYSRNGQSLTHQQVMDIINGK